MRWSVCVREHSQVDRSGHFDGMILCDVLAVSWLYQRRKE
jgi:hypothetical protein